METLLHIFALMMVGSIATVFVAGAISLCISLYKDGI